MGGRLAQMIRVLSASVIPPGWQPQQADEA